MFTEVCRNDFLEYNKHGKSKEEIKLEHEAKYPGKALHGEFQKAIDKVMGRRSWNWLKKRYLKKDTESEIFDQTLLHRVAI